MVGSVHDYLVRGHQKVIWHYKLLLRSPSLSPSERELLQSRLTKGEDELGLLIESVWKNSNTCSLSTVGAVSRQLLQQSADTVQSAFEDASVSTA